MITEKDIGSILKESKRKALITRIIWLEDDYAIKQLTDNSFTVGKWFTDDYIFRDKDVLNCVALINLLG